jgi:hypothetical protein
MKWCAELNPVGVVTAILGVQFASAACAMAAQPSPATTRAYNDYLRAAESRMQADYRPGAAFISRKLLADVKAGGELKGGKVVAACVAGCDSSEIRITGGLIHDSVGAVFIPGATLQQVLAFVQDYDRAAERYSPSVTQSRLIERSGDSFRVFLQLEQSELLTVLFDTDYDIRYVRLDPSRSYSTSHSTRIAQLARGSKDRELPPGEDDGFLWRLDSYWRFEQVPDGVYVQCRAISLSRGIPRELGWIVAPFIKNVPCKSLAFTLNATRAGLLHSSAAAVSSTSKLESRSKGE